MKFRRLTLSAAFALAATLTVNHASAQTAGTFDFGDVQPAKPSTAEIQPATAPTTIVLQRDSAAESAKRYQGMTVAELRQQRAQRLADERAARMARNRWYGIQPLRPTWNPQPSMSSRYPDRRVIYTPIFVR